MFARLTEVGRWTVIDVVAAVIERNGLICCFRKGIAKFDYLSYRFEFPGGKVEPGEDPKAALTREIFEELNTPIRVLEHLINVKHDYPDASVRLSFYRCVCDQDIGRLTEHTEWVELPAHRLNELDWLPADQPAVDRLVSMAKPSLVKPSLVKKM